jgi:hypothetical protein
MEYMLVAVDKESKLVQPVKERGDGGRPVGWTGRRGEMEIGSTGEGKGAIWVDCWACRRPPVIVAINKALRERSFIMGLKGWKFDFENPLRIKC